MPLYAPELRRLGSQPVTLRSSFDLALVSAKPVVRIPASSRAYTRVPGLGNCAFRLGIPFEAVGFECRGGPLQPQRTEIRVTSEGLTPVTVETGTNFGNPYPVLIGLSSVDKWFVMIASNKISKTQMRAIFEGPSTEIAFIPRYPLGTFKRHLELEKFRPRDFPSTP